MSAFIKPCFSQLPYKLCDCIFYIPVSGQLQLQTPFSCPEHVCSWEIPLYFPLSKIAWGRVSNARVHEITCAIYTVVVSIHILYIIYAGHPFHMLRTFGLLECVTLCFPTFPSQKRDWVLIALSESFEVDGWVVKLSGQYRDILFEKCHL